MASDKEKEKFLEIITEIKNLKGISFLDAIIWHCEETGLEISVAGELTNNILKGFLESDATGLKLLKKKK